MNLTFWKKNPFINEEDKGTNDDDDSVEKETNSKTRQMNRDRELNFGWHLTQLDEIVSVRSFSFSCIVKIFMSRSKLICQKRAWKKSHSEIISPNLVRYLKKGRIFLLSKRNEL